MSLDPWWLKTSISTADCLYPDLVCMTKRQTSVLYKPLALSFLLFVTKPNLTTTTSFISVRVLLFFSSFSYTIKSKGLYLLPPHIHSLPHCQHPSPDGATRFIFVLNRCACSNRYPTTGTQTHSKFISVLDRRHPEIGSTRLVRWLHGHQRPSLLFLLTLVQNFHPQDHLTVQEGCCSSSSHICI